MSGKKIRTDLKNLFHKSNPSNGPVSTQNTLTFSIISTDN